MGWKSTINISRAEAVKLIMQKLITLEGLTNKELENMLEELGYGDDANLQYFGYNFNVVNNNEELE